jgi:hypothetical protein
MIKKEFHGQYDLYTKDCSHTSDTDFALSDHVRKAGAFPKSAIY